MTTALTASVVLTPLEQIERAVVLVEDGRITAVGPRTQVAIPAGARTLDFSGNWLVPGLLDLHVHGGAGHDVMHADAAGMAEFEGFLARHGVSSYCPTTMTAPMDTTLRSLEKLGRWVRDARTRNHGRAQPLGIHLEGPFISHAKRGVHPPADLQEPSGTLFQKFWEAAQGEIRIMTVAPELRGAEELIVQAVERGVCVSLGHSDAGGAATRAAIAAGARHATHTFNAMRALDHREPGIVGTVLSDGRVTADIIADGVHIHPEVVQLFLRAKGTEGAVLISDAISATGKPDGRYRLGSLEVEVKGDRCLSAEGKLAGSVLTLDRALRNIAAFAGLALKSGVRLATLNPARVLKVEAQRGTIAVGAHADLVVLSPAGEVVQTVTRGAGL